MIRTDTILTLRDLRGEHAPEVRVIPWGTRNPDWQILYVQHLFELAGVALEWRKDDRIAVPEGYEAPRDEAVLGFAKDIGEAIANGSRLCIKGADCSLIASWEPIADA